MRSSMRSGLRNRGNPREVESSASSGPLRGYVAAAFDDSQPVGAALAVVGRHRVSGHESKSASPEDTSSWHAHLHSHMAGVVEGYHNRHVGTAIKLHQRAWALSCGIDTVVWSFDLSCVAMRD